MTKSTYFRFNLTIGKKKFTLVKLGNIYRCYEHINDHMQKIHNINRSRFIAAYQLSLT